jgi:hypothetical protein
LAKLLFLWFLSSNKPTSPHPFLDKTSRPAHNILITPSEILLNTFRINFIYSKVILIDMGIHAERSDELSETMKEITNSTALHDYESMVSKRCEADFEDPTFEDIFKELKKMNGKLDIIIDELKLLIDAKKK